MGFKVKTLPPVELPIAVFGDKRGACIAVTESRLKGANKYFATYCTAKDGMSFPFGFGDTPLEATRDLWSKLHGT